MMKGSKVKLILKSGLIYHGRILSISEAELVLKDKFDDVITILRSEVAASQELRE